mgnify:CR=1 FL=1
MGLRFIKTLMSAESGGRLRLGSCLGMWGKRLRFVGEQLAPSKICFPAKLPCPTVV